MAIHLSSQLNASDDIKDQLGLRGAEFNDLNQIDVPIAACYIFTAEDFKNLKSIDYKSKIKEAIKFIEDSSEKKRDENHIQIIKIVPSPAILIDDFKSIHNLGLSSDKIGVFTKRTNENFAKEEVLYFYNNFSHHVLGKPSLDIEQLKKKPVDELKAFLDEKCSDVPTQLEEQIEKTLFRFWDQYFSDDNNNDIGCGVIIQEMFYGNTKNGISGYYYTRDTILGDNTISGKFSKEEFHVQKAGQDIHTLTEYKDQLTTIAKNLEKHFKEVKYAEFTVEQEKLCIIRCNTAEKSSTTAQLRVMLDLVKESVITELELIKALHPKQLNDLLHPIVDPKSAEEIKKTQGGIAGSPGAATGKVYFTTAKLMEAFRDATVNNTDSKMILAMKSTYANDVQAIEIGQGVISSEGGYASHAPVVARSLGKPAMVIPHIIFHDDHIILPTGDRINEGDYISIEVPTYDDPSIFFDQISLVYPDFEKNGLNEFIGYVKKYTNGFAVRCNADNPHDAKVGKKLGANGIGLCRTEHMFFGDERILEFRNMIITENSKKRAEALERLKKFQKQDFKGLFEVMDGDAMTIRLLDAPLHEFIPTDKDDLEKTIKFILKKNPEMTEEIINIKFNRLHEVNPMLGHRGCRLAISNPDIYQMQIAAIFEAAHETQQSGIQVNPEVMVPIIMSDEELKFLKNGRDIEGKMVTGILGVIDDYKKKMQIDEFDFQYKIGTMIELPAAALSAAHLSKQAEFFSFGTNDLTQTTHGLSRDDINSFLPSYTQFDIIEHNPFQVLTNPVKELIEIAVKLGKMVRPDIKLGLCGEHGADPENIRFCMNIGLDYVSCSPYGVPVATLSVAQNMLEQNK